MEKVTAANDNLRCSFQWSYSINSESEQESLLELFHENTKLFATQTESGLPFLNLDPSAEFLMSRGYRRHEHRPRVRLPEKTAADVPLHDVMSRRRSRRIFDDGVSLQEFATLVQQSLGPTAIVKTASGTFHPLRAWPSSGGLSCLDTYVVVSAVDGVSEGIYHYESLNHELEELRRADAGEVLAECFVGEDWPKKAAAAIFFVAVFDRLTAKYGDPRSYRLALLDAGHACQNLLLTAEQLRVSAVAVQSYCDDVVAQYLGVDGRREAPIHAVLIGKSPRDAEQYSILGSS